MAAKPYTTLQDIYQEAGLAIAAYGENAIGEVDGTNKVFTVHNKPLVDMNSDDEVTKDDVQMYVNGTPVVVESVNALFGNITLAVAPAAEAVVTVDYRYSSTDMDYVAKLRAEAEQVVNSRMKFVDSCVPYGEGDEDVPATVRNLTRQFAAAWLLIREYGFNQDIEGTSKDGYKRLETVKASLEEYAALGGNCGSDGDGGVAGGAGALAASSDGDLFPEPTFDSTPRPEKDW